MSFYSGMRTVFGPVMKLIYGIRITGKEKVPREGKLLICSNHTSMMDVAIVIASLDRKVRFMAKKEIFKKGFLEKFFTGMGAFPVDRTGVSVGSLKRAADIVESGDAVSIFPQGTRQKYVDPSTTSIKFGAGLIAYRSGCDVLPVFIKTKNNHVRLFSRTELIIGDVIPNSDLGFKSGGMREYETACDRIFRDICALGGYEYVPPVRKEVHFRAEDAEAVPKCREESEKESKG